MSPLAWDSSKPAGPWTVTRKIASMGEGEELMIAAGEEASPFRRVMEGERAASARALGEVGDRVSARMRIGVEDEEESEMRCLITELPWVPVAPVTRRVRVDILRC